MKRIAISIWGLALCLAQPVYAQSEGETNDGTNPALLTTVAEVNYEYDDLRQGFDKHISQFILTIPVGEQKATAFTLTAPMVATDVAANDSLAFGDVSLKVVHVPMINQSNAVVLQTEVFFDTASRPELGTGKTVVKPTFIYAFFRGNGDIFAPALVHSQSIAGDSNRTEVSVTTVDLYYVPKLGNGLFMTLDPAMNFDWERNLEYPSLTVTLGSMIGEMFGGHGQVYIKPSVLFGSDRPANWSIKAGFKVLNF